MRIQEVESLVGITKKNIRFYEKEGLLSPGRSAENGYREYGQAEVDLLTRIKLMRKLGIPLEEIRRMQAGPCTVSDSIRRHLVTLSREAENIRHATELCELLRQEDIPLAQLDAGRYLQEMEELERRGATFMDKQKWDIRPIRYVAPLVITIGMVALMGGLFWLFLWAFVSDSVDAPPLPVVIVALAVPVVVILGVLLALIQRIREIGKGEIEDAKNY